MATAKTQMLDIANRFKKVSTLQVNYIRSRFRYRQLDPAPPDTGADLSWQAILASQTNETTPQSYTFSIPAPIDGLVLADNSIDLANADLQAYANLYRASDGILLADNGQSLAVDGSDNVKLLAGQKIYLARYW